jgi:hypothetical protein
MQSTTIWCSQLRSSCGDDDWQLAGGFFADVAEVFEVVFYAVDGVY